MSSPKRAVIRSSGDRLDVPLRELDAAVVAPAPAPVPNAARGTLADAQRAHILATLNETRWILSGPRGAATRLGVTRSTLQFRMKRLGIARPALAG